MSDLTQHLESAVGPHSAANVSRGFLAKTLAGVCEAMSAVLKKQSARIADLERRMEEVQRKGSGIRYAGVYSAGKTYEAGQFATYQGGLWHCNEDTETRPGSGPHWTLAVKSGREQ